MKQANRRVKLKAHSQNVKPILKANQKQNSENKGTIRKVSSKTVSSKSSQEIPAWVKTLPGVETATANANMSSLSSTTPTEAPSHFRDANTNVVVVTIVNNYYIVKHSKNVKV